MYFFVEIIQRYFLWNTLYQYEYILLEFKKKKNLDPPRKKLKIRHWLSESYLTRYNNRFQFRHTFLSHSHEPLTLSPAVRTERIVHIMDVNATSWKHS